jgi:hypothetical protein
MATGVPSGWRPTLSPSTPQDVKDAIRIIYQKNDELEANAASAIAKAQASADAAQQTAGQSAAATEQLLTQIPGYALLQAGSSEQLRQGQGSVLPISSGAFEYDNSVAGTIKWYFTGLVISWPDGSTTPVPNTTDALPSITIAGLAPGTYYFYPMYSIGLKTVQWAQVAGGAGTPAAAYSSPSVAAGQAQNSDGVVALSLGGITGVVTSGGGGGGSGGGRTGYGFNVL